MQSTKPVREQMHASHLPVSEPPVELPFVLENRYVAQPVRFRFDNRVYCD